MKVAALRGNGPSMGLREAAGLFQPVPKRRASQLFFKGELRGEAISRTQNPPSRQSNDTARNAGWHRASSRIIARPVTAPHGPETQKKGVERIGARRRWATLAAGVRGRPVHEDSQRARHAQPDEPRISTRICSNWTLGRSSLPSGAGQLARTRHGAGRGAPTGYRRRPTRTGSPRSPPGRGRWGNRPRPGPSDDTL